LRAPLRSRLRDDHRLARLRVHEERKRWRGERDMTTQGTKESLGRDVDDVAIERFTAEYGRELPPIVIVIAAYNEEQGIGDVVRAIPSSVEGLPTATVVVVDGSTDGTAAEARKAGAMVCDVPVNRGQGAALRLGYRIAREGGAEYIVTTDADGQYDPADIPRILAPVLH